MSLLNMAGVARPVRIPAKSSLATSIAFSIFSSASRRVSSIMLGSFSGARGAGRRSWCGQSGARCAPSLSRGRSSPGGDQRPDPLTTQGVHDVALALHAEDDHGQLVVHPEAEGRCVHDAQTLLEGFGVGDLVVLAGVRVGAGVGVVDPVDAVLAHENRIALDLE